MEDNNDNSIYNDMIKVAYSDGIISDDEYYMLRQVNIHSRVFFKILDRAREDNIITSEERAQLDESRDDILERTKISAQYDGKISEDENIFIRKLSDILKQVEY